MAQQFRILKPKDRCRSCGREFGLYSMPEEALRLTEDLQRIEIIMQLLNGLDARTIRDDQNESGTTLRRLGFILAGARNQIRDRLKDDFMAGKPRKPRPKRQTMADVWQMLLESLNELNRKTV